MEKEFKLTVRLSEELGVALKVEAATRRTSMQALVIAALEQYLSKSPSRKGAKS